MSEREDFKAWLKTWALPGNTSREDAMYAAWKARSSHTASAEQAEGTTSDKYRAELYDEVWQKARDMGYGNVTDALAEVERLREEKDSYQRVGIKAMEERDALKAELAEAEALLRVMHAEHGYRSISDWLARHGEKS